MESPSILETLLRSLTTSKQGPGTKKALTFLLIRNLTVFPYCLYIISPRKTKAINSNAAKIPPKIPISCAVYILSEEEVSATRKKKTNNNVMKSSSVNQLFYYNTSFWGKIQFLKGKEASCAAECGSGIFNKI